MAFNINIEHLIDKDFLLKSKILQKSFEYTLAKICKEYSLLEDIGNFKEFNDKNKFTKQKLFLYPFFVSTSNGHSKSLFELFGKFYAPSLGPISVEIIKYFFIQKNKSEYFKFNDLNIEIRLENYNNWDELITNIKDSKVIINEEEVSFSLLNILNDNQQYNSLIAGIDSGIKTLKEQSNSKFFIFSEDDLKYQSYKYDAFSSKVNAEDKEIKYEAIEKDKKKLPFYANY